MKPKRLTTALKNLYKFLQDSNFDTRKAIVVGSSALALYKNDLVENIKDVDIVVPSLSSFNKFKNLVNPTEAHEDMIIFTMKRTKYNVGLPSAYGLLPPYNAYEFRRLDGIDIPVRPLSLIEKDWKNYVERLEKEARKIKGEHFLLEYEPYRKYSHRLKLLARSK